jgi:hypothetical protein
MRKLARRTFVVGTWLVGAFIIVQMLLAGLGVFIYPGFFFWHASVNSTIVFFLPLLLVPVGWLARVPWAIQGLAVAVTGLTLLQSLLLIPYHMNAQGPLRAISGLHVLNAIFILWVALQVMERARTWAAQVASDRRLACRPAFGGSAGSRLPSILRHRDTLMRMAVAKRMVRRSRSGPSGSVIDRQAAASREVFCKQRAWSSVAPATKGG